MADRGGGRLGGSCRRRRFGGGRTGDRIGGDFGRLGGHGIWHHHGIGGFNRAGGRQRTHAGLGLGRGGNGWNLCHNGLGLDDFGSLGLGGRRFRRGRNRGLGHLAAEPLADGGHQAELDPGLVAGQALDPLRLAAVEDLLGGDANVFGEFLNTNSLGSNGHGDSKRGRSEPNKPNTKRIKGKPMPPTPDPKLLGRSGIGGRFRRFR